MSGGADELKAAFARVKPRQLVTDSRAVKRGSVFLAYRGGRHDGRAHIAQAIARGARGVVWERARGFAWDARWDVPNAGVRDLRRRAGELAARVYGDASATLHMVGVTGTNGKTTCSQWIARALQAAGRPAAVAGTLGYGRPGRLKPLANTTPDAVWLQRQLAAWKRRGVRAVAMEVSSIGLEQGRVAGTRFDIAVFTNLTRDHLDYHGSFSRYRAAKAMLFDTPGLRDAVVNLDDAYGRTLAAGLRARRGGPRVLGYGFNASSGARVEIRGRALQADARGLRFEAVTPWGTVRVASPVLGRFNASNLLAVLTVLLAGGMAPRRAAQVLARLTPPAGRLQKLGGGTRPLVVVDYAHTPDALVQVLETLRALRVPGARLVCVFGCGGDRDRGKRPQMGRAAARLADDVIVTSDNPRGESPRAIIAEVMAGAQAVRGAAARTHAEPDRRAAIRRAVTQARRGDIVLLAGKGHEDYQEIKGVRRHFSDAEVAAEALRAWRAPAREGRA